MERNELFKDYVLDLLHGVQNFTCIQCDYLHTVIAMDNNQVQWQIQDFPWGMPTPEVGVLTYFFGQKLHENERIWTPRGAHIPGAPLRSATEVLGNIINVFKQRTGNSFSTQTAKRLWAER